MFLGKNVITSIVTYPFLKIGIPTSQFVQKHCAKSPCNSNTMELVVGTLLSTYSNISKKAEYRKQDLQLSLLNFKILLRQLPCPFLKSVKASIWDW